MSTCPSHISIPWQNEFEFSILDYPLSSFGPVYVYSRHSPPSVQKCSTFLLYEYYHFLYILISQIVGQHFQKVDDIVKIFYNYTLPYCKLKRGVPTVTVIS